jgi:arylsulfatase A-like enzyme
LAYIAAMQEHGIPVTFGYLSDAHDPHNVPSGTPAYGPGQAEYTAVLQEYDAAFDVFFKRLAVDGINAQNTLLVVTADEGDHFVGGPPTPPNCDGVKVACAYDQLGEISVDLTGLLATQAGITTPFSVHADAAPAIYLDGQPGPEDASVHTFARALGSLQVENLYTGVTEPITAGLAGEAEQRLLHMITGDPLRTPTLVLFQDPNYYGMTGPADCEKPCAAVTPASAWNHGDIGADINTTWLGIAGPGVQHAGVDGQTWADHADVRPTLLALAGLKDSYSSDGRVLFEMLQSSVLPSSVADQRDLLTSLGRDYKRINAPVGELGMSTLTIATAALEGSSQAQLGQTDAALDDLATRRADLAGRIRTALEAAAFEGQRLDPPQAAAMQAEAQALLDSAAALSPGK